MRMSHRPAAASILEENLATPQVDAMNDTTHELPRLLGRLTTALRVQAQSDPELLRRFTSRHDEDAFAELVRRHGALVLGVCRRVLRDSHAAEDAFQATFLLLARRAARLGREGSLAGWLHGVAWRTALQARRGQERRRRREQQVGRPVTVSADDLVWREVRELLDAELARLPEAYRTALVLCYLEGLPQAEAARRLGCGAGVLRGRLERGRALLRQRLERRGLPEAPLLLLASAEKATPALQAATLAAVRALVAGGAVVRWRVALSLLVFLVAGLATAVAGRGVSPPPRAAMARLAAPPVAAGPRLDRLGDPLPPDALLRLGTLRFRFLDNSGRTLLLDEGRTRLFAPRRGEVCWVDADTGRTRNSWMLPRGLVAAGFSPDGQLALLHDGKRSLQLWDLTTRSKVRTFEDQGDLTLVPESRGADVSVVFSPDARTVLTTMSVNSVPGLLRAWDVATGRQRWHEGKLGLFGGWRVMGFLPDSKTLVLLAYHGNRVSLRDAATGKESRSFPTLPRNYYCPVRLAPDGRALLFAVSDEGVRSWDVSTGKERPRLTEPTGNVRELALTRDSRTLVTGGEGPLVLVWDWPAGKLRRRIDLKSRRTLTHLALSPDGKRLEVGLWPEKVARSFDLATGTQRRVYPEAHTAQVQGLAITPDGKVISGANDDTLRVWDLGTGRQLRAQLTGLRLGAMSLSLSGDGRLAATADINEGQVRVFELPGGRLVRAIDTGGQSVRGVHFCGPGSQLLVDVDEVKAGGGGSRRFLPLWDVQRGREVRRLKLVPTDWQDRAVSRDGRLLAGGNAERLSVWDVAADREWRVLPVKTARPVAFAPDGRAVACNEWERFAVWELGSAQPRWQVERPSSTDHVIALCFSPDGRWLAVARGPRVELRDALSGRLLHTFDGHARDTLALAFSPDGSRLVSSSYDTTLLVWDVAGVLARQPRRNAPADAALSAAWVDLASRDAARVGRAMGTLIDSPRRTVALLRKHLSPTTAADPRRIARHVAELDSDDFATRERASRELETLAEQAEQALRRLLDGKPSPEARRRAERLLRALAAPISAAGRLRQLRALEVLERLGTPEAVKVLQALAGGARDAWLTREATGSVERLRRR
jgi:RNA polymerase sigma factor (sigma-70 family)